MTAGKPAGLILSFALPLMVGNVFQQLYTVIDTIVVGQGVGVEALAALGAADWLHWLVLGIVTGFTQGFSILIAQRFGAQDAEGLRGAVTMTAVLSGIIAVLTTALSLLCARPVLLLMNTPENILDGALLYLRVLFLGIPIVMAYNVLASILRALGNSRAPLTAMLVASLINVGLDLLFVLVFRWGVAGAAAATVLAQAASAALCLRALCRLGILGLRREDWRFDSAVVRRLFPLGVPMAFQNVIIAVGGLVVQSVINGFGFLFVAGFTATNKLYGLLELAATSFGFSMATYTGQNIGAGNLGRVRLGVRSAVKMAVGTSVVISAVMIAFGRPIVSLFISGEPDAAARVTDIAYTYLFIMSALLFILYLLYVYRSALQGMGDTVIPMISGIVELVMRVGTILLLPRLIGEAGVYFAEITAWIGAEVLLMTAFYVRLRRLEAACAPEA